MVAKDGAESILSRRTCAAFRAVSMSLYWQPVSRGGSQKEMKDDDIHISDNADEAAKKVSEDLKKEGWCIKKDGNGKDKKHAEEDDVH